ncbi:MAG: D-alanyl-D-alanine carboxypeptidase [Lachnospiraceae bacterium]|nr:D-alanyl-D-alanine carboxypeptidase [Lachnospiraceae bacterium]
MKKFITLIFVLGILSLSISQHTVLTCATENGEIEDEEKIESEDKLGISSKSAVLMEIDSGTILYEKNPDEQLRPASVTKVMTLLLIFEEIDKGNIALDDVVTITEHAASMGGSQCFFESGEQQKVEDLIKCIVIASGNDAAVAMAEYISGSEDLFVDKMNERAKELGMNNTCFKNACGLEEEGHYTCARDIAIMSRELMLNYPEIEKYTTTWMDYIIHKTNRGETRFDLANTNKFLKQYNGATGLKTGFTSQAKYCISATARRDDMEMVAVIMGADTKEIRNSEAAKLLDYGFSLCEIYEDNQVLTDELTFTVEGGTKNITVYNSAKKKVIPIINGSVDKVEKKIVPYNNLKAPIYEGDIIGVVQYSIDGKVIDEEFIYSGENIEKLTYKYCVKDFALRIFMVN